MQELVFATTMPQTLEWYQLQLNDGRDSTVYDRIPDFWLKRALTHDMIQRASGDVRQLLLLHKSQISTDMTFRNLNEAERRSELNATMTQHLMVADVYVSERTNIPRMIGKKGANINRKINGLGLLMYSREQRQDRKFTVYYKDKQTLKKLCDMLDMSIIKF